MDEQVLVSALSYQAPTYCINLSTCHTCLCPVEATFLCILHYAIHFLHLFGRRAKGKCSCGISYVASIPESKVDHYHITIAKFSFCYFSMWECTVWPSCYD